MREIKKQHLLGCAVTILTCVLMAQALMSEGDFKMEKLTPNLMVNDVNETIAYYEKHFGFKFAMSVPEEGQFDWAMVTAGNVDLMFQRKESMAQEVPAFAEQEPGGSLAMFIQLKSVDELRDRLDSGVEIVLDLETKFYGMREFTIRDLNGYLLTFAERVE